MQNPPTGLTTKTDGDGKFSFTIPGNAPVEGGSVKFEAHFEGDNEYLKSDSNEVTYEPRGGIPTAIDLDPISNVNPDDPIMVKGVLTSVETAEGIENKPITFTASGTVKLSSHSVTTDSAGKFTVQGKAPPSKEALLKVQAHFADDSDYDASDSNVETYKANETMVSVSSVPTATFLTLHPISKGNTDGGQIIVEGVLGVLKNGEQGEGLTEKQIAFTDSGGIGLGSATTRDDGTFSIQVYPPIGRELWKVVAKFDGDSYYESSRDEETYSRVQPVHRIEAEDITYQQIANETKQAVELYVKETKDLEGYTCTWMEQIDQDDSNDLLNEIGPGLHGDLKYDIKNKGLEKTIEYSIFYSCGVLG
jgi:hypothetical protein